MRGEVEININFSGAISVEDAISELRRQVKEHNENGHQAVKELVELSLRTKTLITLVKNQHRGFGKTTELVKKAVELDAILLVGYSSLARDLHEAGYPVMHLQKANFARGRRLGKFLVDEGVSPEVIKELVDNGNEFLGGFNRL